MSDSAGPTPVAWEIVMARSWRKLAVTATSALAVASAIWQLQHPGLLYEFVFRPHVIAPDSDQARRALLPLVGLAALAMAALWVRVLRAARRGQTQLPLHREVLVTSVMALPLLRIPAVEFQHPIFTATLVALVGLAVAWALSSESRRLPGIPDLSPRRAWALTGAGIAVFVLVIGFIAHWRFITFHAETCDTSWEVGAVSGILRHGIPTVSIAAWLYDGKALPAPYFNNHVPFVDYLFVPFYAVYRDPRILFWLQAAFMASGAAGAFLIGRRWFASQLWGVLLAWLYLLNPSVQGFCLHDIHANVLVIPALLLAVGFMEAGRAKTAFGFALLAALCREETPVYAACIGLYWMLSGEDRRRFRFGLAVLVIAIGLQAFFALFLMPHFGGQPRWDHFNFFFDARHSPLSLLGALILNPLGAAIATSAEVKLEYLAISLIPLGGLAVRGWKLAWFALPALLLLVPAGDPGFFSLGVNYSAPLVPAALLMGFAGLRQVWQQRSEGGAAWRAGLVAYVLTTALLSNYLYGNIASKTYKLEYGQSPYRRLNQYDYRDVVGYVDKLPPYGPAQRALWEVIDRVPWDGPILTSWAINPQLSNHDVTFVFGYSGGTPPPEERSRYVVIDKLPTFQAATEPEIIRFRADPRWKVRYENYMGVIFEKK